jgi:uncharacterized membrane protein YfcA
MTWIILFVLGAFVGLLAGLFGIGGGLILVPALSFFLPQLGLASNEQALAIAIATTLTSVAVTGSAAAITHARSGQVDWPSVKKLAFGLIVGAACGALLTHYLPITLLGITFGVIEIIIALQMLWGKYPDRVNTVVSPIASSIFSYFSGLLSALIGIGGGTMNTPWLMWQGLSLPMAIATSSVLGVIIALAGTATHLGSDLIQWPTLFVLVSASLVTAPIGATLTHRLPIKTLKRAFSLLIFVLGIAMLVKFLA